SRDRRSSCHPASPSARTPARPAPASPYAPLEFPPLARSIVGSVSCGSPGVAVEELPIDLDEDDGHGPGVAVHPDGRGHDSGPAVEALPDAARRRTVATAARHLALVFGESFVGERFDDVDGLPRPHVLDL